VPMNHAMKTCGRVEAKLHAFLNSALDGSESLDTRSNKTAGILCIDSWMCARISLS
jgi:hypothetical protein